MSAPGEGTFPIAIKATPCANGETLEYRLMVGTIVLQPSVFRTVHAGDSFAAHAAAALRDLLALV